MKQNYKILFMNLLILSTLISTSSPSWLIMWLSLEINLMSFIPMMKNSNNSYSSESIIKYFIIQATGSTIFLFSILSNFSFLPWILITISIFMKMGMAPFHFWYPMVIQGITWMNCFMLTTIQKIVPLIIISNLSMSFNLMIIPIILTSTVSIISLETSNLRKLMAYSSMNNMSWMTIAIMMSKPIWMFFFLCYLLMNFSIINYMMKSNASFMNNLILNKLKTKNSWLMFMNILSLAGLPPLLGFFPKWLIINLLTQNNFFLINLFIIITSIILMFTYLRMMFSSLILKKETSWNKKMFNMNLMLTSMNLFGLLPWIIFLT